MRIIAGEHKGRHLAAPPDDGTRPTTDRVREALMSSVASARGGFEGAIVLDPFAGSGAMSLEALSRGAEFATLADRDRKALNCVRKNIDDLGYGPDKADVLSCDSLNSLPQLACDRKYDLVFLDPPYATDAKDVLGLLQRLLEAGALTSEAVIVYEHDASSNANVDAAFSNSMFSIFKRREYGRVCIDMIEIA